MLFQALNPDAGADIIVGSCAEHVGLHSDSPAVTGLHESARRCSGIRRRVNEVNIDPLSGGGPVNGRPPKTPTKSLTM